MTSKQEPTTILTQTFQAALGIVSKAMPSKSTLPVLASVYLKAAGEEITMSATDLETSIRVTIPASVKGDAWAACAPGSTLTSLVSAAPGDQVILTWDGESTTLNLKSGGTKSKLKSLAGDEFPDTRAPKSEAVGTIPASELKSALRRVVIAASADESRPSLCVVQLALINEKVYLAAADGFRLAVQHIEREFKFPRKASLLIPRGSAVKLAGILPDDNTEVQISVTDEDRALLMTWEKTVFRAQLADGNFPDWKTIIPNAWAHEVTLKTDELQGAVKRAEIFAREANKVLRFAPNPDGGVRVYAVAEEIGQGETVLTDASLPVPIAFNCTFVRQGLDALMATPVHIRVNHSNAPAMFTNGSDKYRYLLMPMHTAAEASQAAAAAEASEAAES